MKKIIIYELEDAPVCGDGCCHGDGLRFEKDDGAEFFIQTFDTDEKSELIRLALFLVGNDNLELKI